MTACSSDAECPEDEAIRTDASEEKARRRGRKPLPESLPRRDVERHLSPEGCTYRVWGGALRKVGEDVTDTSSMLSVIKAT